MVGGGSTEVVVETVLAVVVVVSGPGTVVVVLPGAVSVQSGGIVATKTVPAGVPFVFHRYRWRFTAAPRFE